MDQRWTKDWNPAAAADRPLATSDDRVSLRRRVRVDRFARTCQRWPRRPAIADISDRRLAATPEEETSKKRLKLFLLFAASGSAIALLVYPAALSAADGKPTKVAVTDEQQTFSFRAGRVCSFALAGTPVTNNQFIKTYPADANGDVRV